MGKVLTILTSSWIVLLILLTVFWMDLEVPFLPIGSVSTFVLFVLGVILIVFWGFFAKTTRRYLVSWFASILIIGFACGFVFLPSDITWQAKFYRHKRNYEARVAEVYQMSPQQLQGLVDANKAEIIYKDCSIDLGPPIRVAFV